MDELKITGINLKNIGKETPFSVPDGYFEDFQAKLNERIHDERKVTPTVKYLTSFKPYLAAAVILIAAILAGTYLYNGRSIGRASERLHSEIYQEVEHELYSISEETILEVMNAGSMDEVVGNIVNDEEMIDYLLNVNLNEEELLNAL